MFTKLILLDKAFQKLNIWLLVVIAAAFQLWDAIITQVYVSSGHVCEGNPLMSQLLNDGTFLPKKLLSIVVSVILVYLLSKFSTKIAARAAVGVVVLYTGVLIWNYTILLSA